MYAASSSVVMRGDLWVRLCAVTPAGEPVRPVQKTKNGTANYLKNSSDGEQNRGEQRSAGTIL